LLTILTTGHPQLGRRAEIPPLAIRHRYFAYPRQRFQGSPRFRWTPSLHDREVRRGVATPQVAYVLQPPGFASLQDQRSAHPEAHMGCRGDRWFRTGVEREGFQNYRERGSKRKKAGRHWYFFAKPASLVACTYVCGIELLGRTVKTNRMEKTRNIVSHFSLKEPGGHLFIHFDIMSLGGRFSYGDGARGV
jgi:hypothetical protein